MKKCFKQICKVNIFYDRDYFITNWPCSFGGGGNKMTSNLGTHVENILACVNLVMFPFTTAPVLLIKLHFGFFSRKRKFHKTTYHRVILVLDKLYHLAKAVLNPFGANDCMKFILSFSS